MYLQSFLGALGHLTLRAVVSEGVWKMLALNMIPHIYNGLVAELEADATSWNVGRISGHKSGEILRT